MDHRARSNANSMAKGLIERMTDLRRDSEALNESRTSPSARYLPVWRGRNFFLPGEGCEPAFLGAGDVVSSGANVEDSILLGGREGLVYFAVDVAGEAEAVGEKFSGFGRFADLRKLLEFQTDFHCELLGLARAMTHWLAHHRFCGKCGSVNLVSEGGHVLACSNRDCGLLSFPRTDPAIIVAVTKGDSILLGRQAAWPPKRYSVIAGFVEPGESLETAVVREALEETGLRLGKVTYRSSQPWPFPCSIMLGFRAESLTGGIILNDRELEEAAWYTREEVRRLVTEGSMILPQDYSISYRLIEEWLLEGSA